jgi:two-component system, OmpR family, copper resistance phosphate regulon response regulator CusR
MAYNVLLVEDDEAIQNFVRTTLVNEGYTVRATRNGIDSLQALADVPADLVLLERTLPDVQGESICVEIKKLYPQLPVIFLTSMNSVQDTVQGLNAGADDYIAKPFAPDELLARVNARLRALHPLSTVLEVADLRLDQQSITVTRGGKELSLTPQEFRLLEYFIQNAGTVLSREMLLNRIWPNSFEVKTRVVDVYVGYLRRKIDAGFTPPLLHSVRGFGYVLKIPEEFAAKEA